MRTTAIIFTTLLALSAAIAAGCGSDEPQRAERGDPGVMMRHDANMHPDVAKECPKEELPLVARGKLTIATTDALGAPWFEGDPASAEGFESAVAVEIGRQLSFEPGEVEWVEASAEDVFEAGPKEWDLAIGQLAWSAERDELADFTRGYYEINQAVVALGSSSVADADSVSDLQDAVLGAPTGAGGEQALATIGAPNGGSEVFGDVEEAVAALEAGRVEGLVVDLPTAFRLARDVEDAEIVGQFSATDPLAYFALVAEEGSPLLECLDLVVEHLGVMTDWLATEQSWWLSERAKIPFFEAASRR